MLLSIITINYNNKRGLQNTIDTVLLQSYKDFEWILIDGCSDDGSKEIIVNNSSLFAYWCSEKDGGIYNGMNKGILHSKGDYLLFLNSGDCLNGDILHKCVPQLTKDIVVGRVKDQQNNKLSYNYCNKDFTAASLYQYSFPHQAVFIKRYLFERYGLYDESYKLLSDWKFFIDSVVWGKTSIRFISDIVSIIEPGGVSSTNKSLYNSEKQRLIDSEFPPLLHDDMNNSLAVKDIKKSRIGVYLFSILYRIIFLMK